MTLLTQPVELNGLGRNTCDQGRGKNNSVEKFSKHFDVEELKDWVGSKRLDRL
jgi:hypothetical protein